MPICNKCKSYIVRLPCTYCGYTEKGHLEPSNLKNTEFQTKMEDIFQEKEQQSKTTKPDQNKTSSTSSSFFTTEIIPQIPLPPLALSTNALTSYKAPINSLFLERHGYLLYERPEVFEKFLSLPWIMRSGKYLRVGFEPEDYTGDGIIRLELVFQGYIWSSRTTFPTFDELKDKLQFPKADFWLILNDFPPSYSPDDIIKLYSDSNNSFLKIFVIDDRIGSWMEVEDAVIYNSTWKSVQDGFFVLINQLFGLTLKNLGLIKKIQIAPLPVPTIRLKESKNIPFITSENHELCIKHGVIAPETKFIKCKICNQIICKSCFEEIEHLYLCPGSLIKTQGYHEVTL